MHELARQTGPSVHTHNVVWGPPYCSGLLRQSLAQPQTLPLSTDEPGPLNLRRGEGPTGRTIAKNVKGLN